MAILDELASRDMTIAPKGENVYIVPADRLTPDLVSRIKAEKPALIRALERVRREAGDDWPEIAANPNQLRAFVELLMIGDMRYRGIAPDHYKAVATCRYCGPVPIFAGLSDNVEGCPWCLNRAAGRPVPRRKP
ncbi:MAG: hypothetical protein HKN55_00110 [Woeseiaceae bacterium]|nr:hypothetical protein [Woeseiaceae bacterium]